MDPLISSSELLSRHDKCVVVDCRFSLTDVEAGRRDYESGHIPGAFYLHLDEDMSSAKQLHGGRHPLPDPSTFCKRLSEIGVGTDTHVVAYDDNRLAFASRLWWMMRALGYKAVQVLDGGYSAWLSAGGHVSKELPSVAPVDMHPGSRYQGLLDREQVIAAQAGGSLLIDSREQARYEGLEEPIDPVAGHIPGAQNRPWQTVTDNSGQALSAAEQSQRWSGLQDESLVVYCGSGVTACVNLLSLAMIGHQDAKLYGGSWSDWCSYMSEDKN